MLSLSEVHPAAEPRVQKEIRKTRPTKMTPSLPDPCAYAFKEWLFTYVIIIISRAGPFLDILA